MAGKDDEDDEWTRRDRERRAMSVNDRIVGHPVRTTRDGQPDIRSLRRTARVLQIPIRAHPRTRAMILAILQRDNLPSLAVFLEEAIAAYLQLNGPLSETDIPSDEDLVRRLERERDKRDDE